MADEGGNDTAGQFFFTLGATPELQNKHSLFGKVYHSVFIVCRVTLHRFFPGDRRYYI